MRSSLRFLPRLAALVAVAALVSAFAVADLTFDKKTTIRIEGTSNVHGWACEAGQLAGTATADAALLKGGTLSIPVSGIDCDNGTMNKNLQKALGASANPLIKFRLTGAEPAGANAVQLKGELTVAGKTRAVSTSAQLRQEGGGLRVSGQLPVKMSEFGVKPPVAMLGAMKTGDAVTVHFDAALTR